MKINDKMAIKAEVIKIEGKCPVHNLKDKIVIEGPQINLKKTDSVCVHALPNLIHYNIALNKGINPKELGLSKKEDKAFIQCPDPGPPFTDGGTVTYKIQRKKE